MKIEFILTAYLLLAVPQSFCGQPFTIPPKATFNGRLDGVVHLLLNGKFQFGVTVNRGEWESKYYIERLKSNSEYTYECITQSGLHFYGPISHFDRLTNKELQFSIPTTESIKEFNIYHKGVPFYSSVDQGEPGAIIWKECELGRFQFTSTEPIDRPRAWVVWNQGRTRESWGQERLQPDGTFTIDPAHLLKPDVLVIVETQRSLRFKRKFLRPGVGEIPQPEWLD